jgi:hypothetical protein
MNVTGKNEDERGMGKTGNADAVEWYDAESMV